MENGRPSEEEQKVNFSMPAEFVPFVQNEFANKGLCQLTFDQAVELTKSIDTLQRVMLIIGAATVAFYIILLLRMHKLQKTLDRNANDVKAKDFEVEQAVGKPK